MVEFSETLAALARTIVQGTKSVCTINHLYLKYSADVALDVYRNNYQENLQDALAGAYPVIKQLVGEDFFRAMARQFIQQHPPRSSNLYYYGAELANFVASFTPAQALVYLADVAKLEWACHEAYFAVDAENNVLNKLAQISAEQYSTLIFQTHPASQLICSAYPIAMIWQAHQPRAASDFQIDLDSGGCYALVSRVAEVVQVNEISVSEAKWLQQIQQGASLGDAINSAVAQQADFDLQAMLINLVTQNVLIDAFIPTEIN